ncbi:hypothetical protein QJS04_geneDACA001151 [Acorus gramineus]|uniref:Dirigent protein n=1 Tax=Acorus gramineus TaxID=55184 RepID=A0AAV9AFD9_ACOGR|nr:hypothetical protein QJS04_geneDACA001151 [Acorus gramineus]
MDRSVALTLLFLLLTLVPPPVHSRPGRFATETETHLHFYFHDTVSGSNPSAVQIARADSTGQSPTSFGVLLMADDPLTEGPDAGSTELGRAQGLYGSAGQKDFGLIMALSFRFTSGPYKGSSLSVMSQNPAMQTVRELAVVGGTGAFRMARGFAVAKTYFLDTKTGDAIVEYNVTVMH